MVRLKYIILCLSVFAATLCVSAGPFLQHKRKAFQVSGVVYTDYIDLTAADPDYIDTPDSASYDTGGGENEWVMKLEATDWTPTSIVTLCSRYGSGLDSFLLRLVTTGHITTIVRDQANTQRNAGSTAATGFSDGTAGWIKLTYDWTNSEAKFYTATTEGLPGGGDWSQLGTTVTLSGGTSMQATSQPIELGAFNGTGAEPWDGKIYYFDFKDAIDGTIVATFNASVGSDPNYDNAAGETDWTNNGGTPGSD